MGLFVVIFLAYILADQTVFGSVNSACDFGPISYGPQSSFAMYEQKYIEPLDLSKMMSGMVIKMMYLMKFLTQLHLYPSCL